MNNLERHEHRYFCDSRSSNSVERVLGSLGVLTRIFYSLPITETVYFTSSQQGKYEAPAGMIVRLRRYVAILSETIEISENTVLLEIKRDDSRVTGVNVKERVSVPGMDALKALAGIGDRLGLRQKLGIIAESHLLPTGATQSYRCHWVHQSGMRVTFDRDIRFFLFRESLCVAYMVFALGEGKLEFKFPKANGRDEALEEKIVVACGCVKHSQDYLERRARECVVKYMSKKAES